MRGLIKATHYYSSLEARRDWLIVCQLAKESGVEPPAIDHEALGHKRLDKHSEKLLAQIGRTWEDIKQIKEAR